MDQSFPVLKLCTSNEEEAAALTLPLNQFSRHFCVLGKTHDAFTTTHVIITSPQKSQFLLQNKQDIHL